MGRIGLKQRPKDLATLQAVAAIGQSYLVEVYDRSLRAFGHHAAQIPLTASGLDERARCLTLRYPILTRFDVRRRPATN